MDDDPNRLSDERKGCWWVLFPYSGLTITDETVDLDRPMFGDATVISMQHVPLILSQLERGALVSESGAVRALRGWIDAQTKDKQNASDSFIAVRRSGVLSRHARQDSARTIEQARSRAYEIGALLSMAILAHWDIPQT